MIQSLFGRLRQRARRRRYDIINRLLSVEKPSGMILDLGGGPASFFPALFPRPEQVVLLDVDYNTARRARQVMPVLQTVVADGAHLPFADQSIGTTICNSVIEHVDEPDAFAREIQRASRDFFVQTPNGRFPLETHSFIAIPFYNLIPSRRLRRWLCRLFGASFEYIDSVRYLPEQRLRALFPDASCMVEKALGLTKSYYIYRRHSPSK